MSSATTSSPSAISPNLLWASTGGGWRAMFADVGFANVFQQAGLLGQLQDSFSADSNTHFRAISTVSGGSWFSTQLFYSAEFYNRTAMAESPGQIHDFVVEWMATYYNISTEISPETVQACDFTDLYNDQNDVQINTLTEFCYLLDKYDYDWALFVQAMLRAASEDYGSPSFVDTPASAANIIAPLRNTDLLIQSALAPASRVRGGENSASSTAVYLGNSDADTDHNGNAQERLWTVALSAAWIVDTLTETGEFVFGVNEEVVDVDDAATAVLQTYVAPTSNAHSWDDWRSFYLYKGNGTTTGNRYVNNTIAAEFRGVLQPPFGGTTPTTLQVAAISSAAAGTSSPLAPVSFSQNLSIGLYVVEVNITQTVWRVLAGIAAGLGVGLLLGWAIAWASHKWNLCRWCNMKKRKTGDNGNNRIAKSGGDDEYDGSGGDEVGRSGDNEDGVGVGGDEVSDSGVDEDGGGGGGGDNNDEDEADNKVEYNNCCCCDCERPARKWGIGCGVFFGILVGVMTGIYYGLGSIIVPNVYDNTVDRLYQNGSFDNFAVCSQWPNLPCQEVDTYMIDGWFVDNPALPINIGHRQQKIDRKETIKVILTNCNEVWDTEWTRAQYLAYFSTYFNTGIAPGEFMWGPGWFVPSRSQQIFSDYLDPAGLDALLEPIANSNMTTALLQGTTIDNPAYGVRAGQRVEMLLLNANANITTNVIGKTAIETWTQPLADMASHIAGSEELVARVLDFVEE